MIYNLGGVFQGNAAEAGVDCHVTSSSASSINSKLINAHKLLFTGQVGLGIGSWTSQLMNVGSIPCAFD